MSDAFAYGTRTAGSPRTLDAMSRAVGTIASAFGQPAGMQAYANPALSTAAAAHLTTRPPALNAMSRAVGTIASGLRLPARTQAPATPRPSTAPAGPLTTR